MNCLAVWQFQMMMVKFFIQKIEKALASGNRVTVDFNGVDVVLAQFLNAAIAALYENHGSEELKEKLVISGLKSTDSLRKVIARAKSFYANKKVSSFTDRNIIL